MTLTLFVKYQTNLNTWALTHLRLSSPFICTGCRYEWRGQRKNHILLELTQCTSAQSNILTYIHTSPTVGVAATCLSPWLSLQHRIAQSIESVDNMIQRIQYDPVQYNILNDPYVSLCILNLKVLYTLSTLTISGIHLNKVYYSLTTPVQLSHFGIRLWVHLSTPGGLKLYFFSLSHKNMYSGIGVP